MDKYTCKVCGYVYDPAEGDSDGHVEPGIPFATLSEDWSCPQCGAAQSEFELEGGPMPGMVAPVGE